MSTKLQCSKNKPTTIQISTNLRQTTTKSQKLQSSTSVRSSASCGSPTTRSTNSTSSSASSCDNRRGISTDRILSKSGTNNTTKCSLANKNSSTSKRFIVHTSNNSASSPFRSFITRGPRMRQPLAQANDFAYDLSKDESKFMGTFKGPMKAVPDKERDLLKSGQRGAYLAVRYEHSPDRKYNYPQATSWRIGWFHNQMTKPGVAI
ncbi:serine-rich adhesin for platelets [Eurosta solidaginis]|uniref:serine-rich adhesin for platelets n=1 Tax=Eurosta solidaginis TaxID=178769 RepID=UPI0035313F7B